MNCTYLGPNGDEHCELPAAFKFRWPWGAEGSCCAHHQPHLTSLAKQLDVPSFTLTPLESATELRDTLPPAADD